MSVEDFMSEEEYVAQMRTGALLNPRVDSTFKALFTQPTTESKEALHSFLEAATERKIKSFTLSPNDAPGMFPEQRGVSYDILCVFDDGLSANIEMQAFNQKYDYGKRAEYQVARLETTYLKSGAGWEKAPVVFQISVLDFTYNKDEEDSKKVVSRYAMRTKDGNELSNTLNIIFIELPKVERLEDSLDTNTALENWALFLKEADDPKKTGLIEKLTEKEAGLMQAQKSLSSISANQELWLTQYRLEIAERDRISGLEASRKEGIAQGIAQNRVETARRLLSMNIPFEQVAKGTGLSLDEVKKLMD
ncbi:MAG: Rpn family recombination-promoting nuclease/putative transposase [Treponema sp.]|nr:Rpn family recombination-promoting nuclease/putative transposase [Treponema sp.]